MTYPGDDSRSVTYLRDRVLFQHHIKELHESSIDDGIIDLNFRSLSGDEPKEYLFCRLDSKKRLNDGRVNSSTLYNYRNTEVGGYWISGLNPHNGWQPWDWGRFKPDCPYIDAKNNKPIKYLSPPNGGSHPIYLDVPQHIWDKVAQRYRISRYHSPLMERLADKRLTGGGYTLSPIRLKRSLSDCLRVGIKPVSFLPKNLLPTPTEEPETSNEPYCFWSWVKAHPEIPIILTEGEKKAACLLSLGFVAISLPGIWMGRVKNEKTGTDYLHPDLLPMVEAGRKFVILFDNDPKPSTKRQVNKAIERTGQVIEKAGATCEVALLPEDSEKGVDDYVTANGGEAATDLIAKIVKAALSFKGFLFHIRHKRWGLSSKYPANLKVNTPRISEFVKLFPNSGLIVLWSGMNTGKTYLLEQRQSRYPEERFLNLGHRVNLLQNLSKRLKTDIYSEISVGNFGRVNRLSITLDSLYKLQNNLNDYDCVFIDEACQNLTHLLHSKTCSEYRAEILEILEVIVRKAKLVILADAHMDDVTVDFFRQMRPIEEVPFIIHNEYQPGNREVYLYNGNDSSALVERILCATMTGQKIMVVADSKEFIKKIEELLTEGQGKKVEVITEARLKEKGKGSKENTKDLSPLPLTPYPNQNEKLSTPKTNKLRVWSIHGENSGTEENKIFIRNISSAVKDVDVLLASPSLGTGVDIGGDRFEAVFGAFHATTQSATECAQHLHRFRKNVPIHLWIAQAPPFGYQETDPQKIKEKMLQSNKMTAFLIRLDKETYTRGAEKDWALDAYCQIEANRNRSINNLREDLQALLTEMGYNLSVVSSETAPSAKELFKEAASRLTLARRLAIVNAQDISPEEYQSRQTKDFLSPDEMVECEKYRIKTFYGKAVTEDLVERDNGGRLYSRLLQLEAVCADSTGTIVDPDTRRKYQAPPEIVAQRDLNERERLAYCMDWHNYSSQWLALHLLGVPKLLSRLFSSEKICATDPDLMRMTEMAISSRCQIKTLLNLTVPSDCKPLWFMGVILDRLGLKTISHKEGSRGQQVTYRRLCPETFEFALEVLTYREQVREQKAERQRQLQSDNLRYQEAIQRQYGIEPTISSVSTPLQNEGSYTLEGGVDTNENKGSRDLIPPLDTWEVFAAYSQLIEEKIQQGIDVIYRMMKGGMKQVTLLPGILGLLALPIDLIPLE